MPDTDVQTPDQSASTATTDVTTPDENTDATALVDDAEVAKRFSQRKEACKHNRRERAIAWKRNVDLRIGTIASQFTDGIALHGGDEIRTAVNPDWSLTKTKTANLFSQVPQVQLTHENTQYVPAIQPFGKALNYELSDKRANAGPAMEEVLNDVVNASGVGFIYVDYIARFEDQTVPADPLSGAPAATAPKMISDKFRIRRKSPTDGLWPVEFINSDFNEADFIGYTDRWSWADAVNEWEELKAIPDAKSRILQGVEQKVQDDLRENPERANRNQEPKVLFDHIFYWRARVDPEEKHLNCIWEVVYIHGLDDPIVHRQWKGQKLDPASNQYIGAVKFPVQILTITYITDNPLPPSDSEVGRPQVNDLRRSRSQMFMNRERSLPLRWFDVNRVDPLVQDALMRGVFQAMIPTNGPGDRSFGEVARAAYPQEDFAFDDRTKADLMESWMIGPNQQGTTAPGDETATQAQITQSNFTTRVGQERNAVARFFTNICEVLAGLMSLYSTFPTLSADEKTQMQQVWNQQGILGDVVFKIRPDSQIVLDSNARTQKLAQFLNLTVKSGYVDPMPILIEMAELAGLDPTKVVKPPTPADKDVPQMSIRFTGKEDLTNNLVMALLSKHGQAPSAQDIQTATNILALAQKAAQDAMDPANPDGSTSFVAPPSGGPGGPGGPAGPGGPGAPPAPPTPPGAPPHAPGGPPSPTAPAPQTAHPNWSLGDRVMKRSRDLNGG